MKLETLKLTDVLSHVESEVALGETLTVFTGPSDSGKSSALRGLDQTLRNRPAGIDLLRHGAKRGGCSEVLIKGTDGGKPFSLARRRGKSRNEYELDGQPLLAFGQEVPVEVASRLKLSAHAFQLQSDGSFMLCETDGQVAKMLSGTVGLAQIDAAFTEVRKRKTANDTALACAEADEKREKDALERFCGLDDAGAAVVAFESLDANLTALCSQIDGAETLAAVIANIPGNFVAKLSALTRETNRICALGEACDQAALIGGRAEGLLQNIERLPEDVSRRLRSAKAALLGAESASVRWNDADSAKWATLKLAGALTAFPATANIVPADKAIDVLERADAALAAARAEAEAVSKLLTALEKLPAHLDGKLRAAQSVIAEHAQLADERDKVAIVATSVVVLLSEIVQINAHVGVCSVEIQKAEQEIERYKELNKVCPECGAEQKHWHKGE